MKTILMALMLSLTTATWAQGTLDELKQTHELKTKVLGKKYNSSCESLKTKLCELEIKLQNKFMESANLDSATYMDDIIRDNKPTTATPPEYKKLLAAFKKRMDKIEVGYQKQLQEQIEKTKVDAKELIRSYMRKKDLASAKDTNAYMLSLKIDKPATLAKTETVELPTVVAGVTNDKMLKVNENDEKHKSITIEKIEKGLGYKTSALIRKTNHKLASFCKSTGNYYKFFPTGIDVTWEQAQQQCREMGGHLVTITNENEMSHVLSLPNLPEGQLAFIGKSDMNLSGNWEWITKEKMTYINWYPGQPDGPKGGSKGQYYGLLYKNHFSDVNNNWQSLNGFICEWPK
ncbi:C-type lectin domain-containing protein [Lentisphaera profundi]|uniref:C-type lectin domain-containing protein n=1 Tax=Lentisphaera profundi TaxID=1658616 RepID=A0ABY7VNH4_9BACT|nr:C-type lectin domain-containing protein [Lentisphaera profundi]WDE95670.1 C-type lectin domain-containing protein [Lentisphaera profundi]